ncbi:MAG: Macrolide-specific ABC transporter ATPase [Candidatus Moranbacteria bacterium GW2011_GWE1_36_7]|nr:MAG: Macrolide-specific ABC transporter ATPase [Candidatus Moranbacteria bacterium GW2011_GWD2_36_12]KKQ05220.1 MAG: Macrolide-specific ABC transporter ATPase [Candidatus Moranbacteria bacterium GW2011_GWE2_36_40]KKQ14358.1 MAG: Macrolide-specific ABC transporter ATPase [Candidatus Moranbacteria bacterium GW2011_GWE1_36_7]
MNHEKPIISLQNIKKSYLIGDTSYEALKGVSFDVFEGDFISIMGPSGSGKSTLMNIIGTLDVATKGKYFFNDLNITHYTEDELAQVRNEKIGFVFQSFNLIPRVSVYNNIERPMIYSNKITRSERRERVVSALKAVHLENKIDNMPNQLSGGQVQRVAIARSLVMNPEIILADEPTGNLDSKTSHDVMQFFQSLNQQGKTIILITHESDIAAYAKKSIILKDGFIVEEKSNSNNLG